MPQILLVSQMFAAHCFLCSPLALAGHFQQRVQGWSYFFSSYSKDLRRSFPVVRSPGRDQVDFPSQALVNGALPDTCWLIFLVFSRLIKAIRRI
jgi:hypothetical protein